MTTQQFAEENKGLLTAIIAFEMGEMEDEEDVVALFQRLIDTNLAWQLQGTYGRTALHYLELGLCTPPQENMTHRTLNLVEQGGNE